MKTTLITTGILALALGAFGNVSASDCHQTAKAGEPTACCPLTAAKEAHTASLEATGCATTAKTAATRAMGEAAYANALAESHCPVTAGKATYAYVKEEAGCDATATAAYQHAVAQAAQEQCLSETGCAVTAEKAYEKAAKVAGAEAQKLAEPADKQDAS